MTKAHFQRKNREKGIVIYIAVTITAALILVSLAILNFALKQKGLSNASRDSQAAFYAADSGIECALYWDLKNTGVSAFATSTAATNVNCNNKSVPVTKVWNAGTGYGTSTLSFDFSSADTYCATVSIVKRYSGGNLTTRIESRGYNVGTASGGACTSNKARRVERAVLVTY